MDKWWVNDDPCSSRESSDNVFGTVLQAGSSELSGVGLTQEDYAELEELLKENATAFQTRSPDHNVSSPACSTNSEGSVESPMTPGEYIGPLDSTAFPDLFGHIFDDQDDSMITGFLQQDDVLRSEQDQVLPTEDIDDIIKSFLEDFPHDESSYKDCVDPSKPHTPLSRSAVEVNSVTPPYSPDQRLPGKDDPNDGSGMAEAPTDQTLSVLGTELRSTPEFRCQFCVRTFKHKIGLKNHERSHLRGETHVCGYCGETFRYKNKLRRHVNIHAKQLRICRYCGVVQADDYAFVQHEKRHKLEDRRSVPDCVGLLPQMVSSGLNQSMVEGSRVGTAGSGILIPMHYQEIPWSPTGRTHPYTRPLRYNSV